MPLFRGFAFGDPGRPHPILQIHAAAVQLVASREEEAMSNDSELGTVLVNAPRLEKAFGRKLAAFITLVSLYFARRPSGIVGLIASLLFVSALVLQAWLRLRG
jgi:hypothetical protein